MIKETLRRMVAAWKLQSGQCTVCDTPLRDDAKKYSQCSEACQIEHEEYVRAW